MQTALQLRRVRNEARAQFETLLNEAPLGVYVVDEDLRIRQANPKAMPVFGNIPDLIGRDLDEVIHRLWPKESADELVRRFRHTLATGESYEELEYSSWRIDRSGTEYYEWRINRIPLPDGRFGVVCYSRDVSAQVSVRREIERSEERFRAFVTATADVIYQMSPDWSENAAISGQGFHCRCHGCQQAAGWTGISIRTTKFSAPQLADPAQHGLSKVVSRVAQVNDRSKALSVGAEQCRRSLVRDPNGRGTRTTGQ